MSNTSATQSEPGKTKDKAKGTEAAAAAPSGGKQLSPEKRQLLLDSGITEQEIEEMNADAAKAASGFEDRTSDVVGYWDPEICDLHCIPENAKLFDGGLQPEKASGLITVKVATACVVSAGDEKDPKKKSLVRAKVGDKVGIWVKPGMKDIVQCCGVETRIALSGSKDVHKGRRGMNPMKTFAVTSDKLGTRIPVVEDRRVKSKTAATIFDVGSDDDEL